MPYRFVTPTVEEAPLGEGPLLERYKLARGITVLKEGAAYRQLRWPTDVEIAAATITYLGGHEYTVTDAEATALTAAGYGAFLTPL